MLDNSYQDQRVRSFCEKLDLLGLTYTRIRKDNVQLVHVASIKDMSSVLFHIYPDGEIRWSSAINNDPR